MPTLENTHVLNQLLRLHSRSLATYLSSARPWRRTSDRETMETLDQIAADHSRTVDRLATTIIANRGAVSMGEFPMEFTDLHDLSAEYLLSQVEDKQQQIIDAIQTCIVELEDGSMHKAMAEEILGEAKGHLDNLRDVSKNGSS